jgi:3-deoxy-D-manno-octulosonate 8-phosphate phosphatase (KDO 8-P phosphatase)
LSAKNWNQRAKEVRLLLLDVDGVLTDGRIIYDSRGQEIKCFNIKDGQGIRLLQEAGLEVGILSGRKSSAVRLRAKDLGIRILRQDVHDKAKDLARILRQEKLKPEQIGFVGDDLVDLPVFQCVGLAIAVADAAAELKAQAHLITRMTGGKGAVREVCERILKAQGKWSKVIQKYSQRDPA